MPELTPAQIYHKLEDLLFNAKCRLSLPMRVLAIHDGNEIEFNPEERLGIFNAMASVIQDLETLCYEDNSSDPFAVDLEQHSKPPEIPEMSEEEINWEAKHYAEGMEGQHK